MANTHTQPARIYARPGERVRTRIDVTDSEGERVEAGSVGVISTVSYSNDWCFVRLEDGRRIGLIADELELAPDVEAPRCEYTLLGDNAPRCSRPAGHDGSHWYKCAGEYCPGIAYPAHVLAHPASCTEAPTPAREAILEARGK